VLSGLARALRLSDDERAHLFQLAGELPHQPSGLAHHVSAGMLQMLQRLQDIPAMIIDAKFEILAWNELAAALLADFSVLAPKARNLARLIFTQGTGTTLTQRHAGDIVADLRTTMARYPDDAGLKDLVAELTMSSDEFARLWANHDIGVQRTMCTVINHPTVGALTLCCEMLHIPDRDQRLILYTADPGSPSWDALRLLTVIGTQDLNPTATPVTPAGRG
jgi:hypothetical protein